MRARIVAVLLLVLSALSAPAADDAERGHWVVLATPELIEIVRPLRDLREKQGYDVAVLNTAEILGRSAESADDAPKLAAAVQAACGEAGGLSYVLLLGAAVNADENATDTLVPAFAGEVARMRGQPTDMGYAGKYSREFVVGRLPARTRAEAEAMIRKTIAWEQSRQPGAWKRRVLVLAGAPSYNPTVDRMVEGMALGQFEELIPYWSGQAIYRNPNSPYVLADDELWPAAQAAFKTGPALTVYLGHSNPDGFWHRWVMREEPASASGDGEKRRTLGFGPICSRENLAQVEVGHVGGIFATFGCFGAQFCGKGGEGYGLFAIRNPHGPVSVVGFHGECWAAMAMLSAQGLLAGLPTPGKSTTVGELYLHVRRNLAQGQVNPLLFNALNAVDGDPRSPIDVQRREHLEMIALLGDPAARLPGVAHELKPTARLISDGAVNVRCQIPSALRGGSVQVCIERKLTSAAPDLETVDAEAPSAERAAAWRRNYERSNRFVIVEQAISSAAENLEVTLKLPAGSPRSGLVARVYVERDGIDALGACVVGDSQ